MLMSAVPPARLLLLRRPPPSRRPAAVGAMAAATAAAPRWRTAASRTAAATTTTTTAVCSSRSSSRSRIFRSAAAAAPARLAGQQQQQQRRRFASTTTAAAPEPDVRAAAAADPPPPPSQQSSAPPRLELQDYDLSDPDCNVPASIAARVGTNLHRRPHHPLHLIQQRIVAYYNNNGNNHEDESAPPFPVFTDLSPVVSTEANFDSLGIPIDHPSRLKSDTYYLNCSTVLRTHTSAHQVELLRQGHSQFLISGDVYRRDDIDRSHSPVFHQMEGVKLVGNPNLDDNSGLPLTGEEEERTAAAWIEQDLKRSLEGLARHLFGPAAPLRWVPEHFPFTDPSWELEVRFPNHGNSGDGGDGDGDGDGEWMEVLGCGVIHPSVLRNAGREEGEAGWAFGLGLERLAMVLYQIPDIRLFWTDDDRFHRQFAAAGAAESDDNVTFQPYSKYPPCFKDVSFWIDGGNGGDEPPAFHVNDLNEVVRDVAGDLVEQVELADRFVHPQTRRTSHCYRIAYRSMDRSLTNAEVDALQERIRTRLVEQLRVELR